MKHAILISCLFLSSCGDNPFYDIAKIEDTDYARIRIEMERCNHVTDEGSFIANMHFSPKMQCLNHLKQRIIVTGNANKEFYR